MLVIVIYKCIREEQHDEGDVEERKLELVGEA